MLKLKIKEFKIEFQNTPWLQEKGKDIESIQLKVTYIVHHAISKVISKGKRYKSISSPYKENKQPSGQFKNSANLSVLDFQRHGLILDWYYPLPIAHNPLTSTKFQVPKYKIPNTSTQKYLRIHILE